MRFSADFAPAFLVAVLLGGLPLRGADQAATSEIVERYEQMVERAPMAGEAFDRLVQEYQRGAGLDQLDRRWAELAAAPGANGANFEILRGLLADLAGRNDDARRHLETATKAQPDDYRGWLALGDSAVHQGRWDAAIDAYRKGLATKVAGEDRLALFRKLGQTQERNLDLDGGLATWRQMVAEFPDDRYAVEEAGNAELDAGQFDDARLTFQKLADLAEPDSMNRVQALMLLAEADDRQGRAAAAVTGYEKILPLTAEGSWINRQLRAQIEQIFRRDNDLAGLAAYYRRWIAANPKDVDALLLLSGVLTELGQKPEALDALRQTAELAPDRHEVRATLGERLIDAGQDDEAIDRLTALTADDDTEPRYWQLLGEAIWQKTQPPTAESKAAALAAWRHLTPAGITDVAALLGVAELLAAHHLADEALADYRRALALAPEAADIREKIARLLVAENRPEEAWPVLADLVAGERATGSNYARLATLERIFKREDAATDAIHQGLEREPKNFELLNLEWSRLAGLEQWAEAAALFDRLSAAAPDAFAVEQVENRQLQALASAGQLDDTAQRLQDRLTTLTEPELRLLLRILIQRSDGAIPAAFAEAHRRFPKSESLIRLESDFDRSQGNFDGAVSALQSLADLDPQQRVTWLEATVQTRRDQGNLDEALATADQIIKASPTNPSGYLLYADVAVAAGKADLGLARLHEAIRLTDRPNDIRQRLARLYLDAGEAGQARNLYDEAFAAAQDPTERLALVRQMAVAYYQDNRIEELLSRFKQEQKTDPEGGRFGAYLAIVYEQMQDPGSARKELAKELASRPHDPALLRSLVDLADQEGARDDLLRYRRLLAEADPAEANVVAYAAEFARQGKSDAAWGVMQEHQAEIMKNPLAWRDLPNLIPDGPIADRSRALLEEAISQQGANSLGGRFLLGQFQILEGNLVGAEKTFWDLIAAPLPDTPPPAPPASGEAAPTVLAPPPVPANQPGGALALRLSRSNNAVNQAQQFLATWLNRNNAPGGVTVNRRISASGATLTPDPAAIRDQAAAYLLVLALQHGDGEQDAAKFLQELTGRFAALHRSIADRLVVYTLIQAPEPLLQTIEELVKTGTPDQDADEFALARCAVLLNSPNVPFHDRAEAAQAALLARIRGSDPKLETQTLYAQAVQAYNADPSPATDAKRQEAEVAYLATFNRRDPAQLLNAVNIAANVGDDQGVRAAVAELLALPAWWNQPALRQQLARLPLAILNSTARRKPEASPDLPALLLKVLRLGRPSSRPPPLAPAQTNQRVNAGDFPPPNRYFSQEQLQALQQLLQQLRGRGLLPAMDSALDDEARGETDWRQMYPLLMRTYFQWWDNRRDDAAAAIRAALDRTPDDDLRRLLAGMLIQQQKFADALPVLEAITARYGPDYVSAQMLLLRTAAQTRDMEVGQAAGQRLIALRLSPQDASQIVNDLRAVGLRGQADELNNRINAANGRVIANGRGGPNASGPLAADQKLQSSLLQAINAGDADKLVELARPILDRDPQDPTASPLAANLRRQAINGLKAVGRLAAYAKEIALAAAANPSSDKTNLQAAEALQSMADTTQDSRRLRPGFHWLRVERAAGQFIASVSYDGQTWKMVGAVPVDLAPRLLVGVWVGQAEVPANGVFDQIAFTGKTGLAPASATSTASTPAAPPAPATVPAPWQEAELSTAGTPGGTKPGADGALQVASGARATAGSDDSAPDDRNDAGHFVYQALEGDGSIVVRLADVSTQTGAAEIGVMLRESLDPGSPRLELAVSNSHGLVWQNRMVAGNSWSGSALAEFGAPAWLKLARVGARVVASYSDNGRDWSEVFSRELTLGPTALAGVTAAGATRSHPMVFHWSDIRVQAAVSAPTPVNAPTGPSSGSASGLPAPWQYRDVGPATAPGAAVWNAGQVTLTAPAFDSVNQGNGDPFYDDDEEFDFEMGQPFDRPTQSVSPFGTEGIALTGGFLYQPVAGDGSVAGLDGVSENPGANGHTAISFRASAESGSPEVRLWIGSNHVLYLTASTDAHSQALDFFNRAIAQKPASRPVMLQAITLDLQAGRLSEADTTLARLLKSDPGNASDSLGSAFGRYQSSGHLAEFLAVIQAWNPPAENPIYGGSSAYGLLFEMGQSLQRSDHLPEAERMLRKALSLNTRQDKDDAYMGLVQLLMAENKRGEASAALERWFRGEAPAAAPVLGFNTATPVQGRSGFLRNGWGVGGIGNAQGEIAYMDRPQSLRMLDLATDLGLGERFREIMLKEPATVPPTQPGGLKPDRLISLFLHIKARDPAYRAELDRVLQDYAASASPASGTDPLVLLQLAHDLGAWPEERAAALKIDQAVWNGYASNHAAQGNDFDLALAAQRLLSLAESVGDHATARATLQSLAASLGQPNPNNPFGASPSPNLVFIAIRGMVREGMYLEATTLLEGIRADPTLTSQIAQLNLPTNMPAQQQAQILAQRMRQIMGPIDALQALLDSAKGEKSPTALVYGLDSASRDPAAKPGEADFFWELQVPMPPANPSRAGNQLPVPGWIDWLPARPTESRLLVEGGPDQTHLSRIALLEQVTTHGQARLALPAGTAFVRATLLPPESASPPPEEDAPVSGSLLPIGAGANLLPNPGFAIAPNQAGVPEAAGWAGIDLPQVTVEKGGPRPGGEYVTLPPTNYANGNNQQITSARIPLPPGGGLVFTGWVSNAQQIQFLFFDAAGNAVGRAGANSGGLDDQWHWISQNFARIPSSGRPTPGTSVISPRAESMEVMFQGMIGIGVDSLSLRALALAAKPAPAANTPAPSPDE